MSGWPHAMRELITRLDQQVCGDWHNAVVFVLSMLIYPLIGTELFPQTDAGQFIIDYRAPVGTRIEITEELTERMENLVRCNIPANELTIVQTPDWRSGSLIHSVRTPPPDPASMDGGAWVYA